MAATGDDSLYDSRYFEALENWHHLSQPEFGAFLRAAVKPGRERALDLGCGSGAWGERLAELACHVDGCDLAAAGLERARRTGHYEKLFTADLSQAENPLPEGHYDLVFTTEVIEHVPDYRLFCEHVAQALVPGGQLVLTTTTYHLYLFYYWLYHEDRRLRDYVDFALGCVFPRPADRFVRRLWMLTGGHEHGFRRHRLLRAIRAAGLRIERCRYAHPQPVCVGALPSCAVPCVPPGGVWTGSAVRPAGTVPTSWWPPSRPARMTGRRPDNRQRSLRDEPLLLCSEHDGASAVRVSTRSKLAYALYLGVTTLLLLALIEGATRTILRMRTGEWPVTSALAEYRDNRSVNELFRRNPWLNVSGKASRQAIALPSAAR
ncbi:MAG: class I SAM-dependent methyltransferase [Acidobacteriota bacterium]